MRQIAHQRTKLHPPEAVEDTSPSQREERHSPLALRRWVRGVFPFSFIQTRLERSTKVSPSASNFCFRFSSTTTTSGRGRRHAAKGPIPYKTHIRGKGRWKEMEQHTRKKGLTRVLTTSLD